MPRGRPRDQPPAQPARNGFETAGAGHCPPANRRALLRVVDRGQTKTRFAIHEPGCLRRADCDRVEHFTEDRKSASTISTVKVEVRVCATRCRFDFSHSLLQSASAGRNVITVFHSVNKCTRFFCGGRGPCDTGEVTREHACMPTAATHIHRRKTHASLKANSCKACNARERIDLHAGESLHRNRRRNEVVNISPLPTHAQD